MSEELGTSVKIAISMTLVVSIIFIIVCVNSITKQYSSKYVTQVNETANPKYEATLKSLCFAQDAVPAPSIYSSMYYCEDAIAQITYIIGGVNTDYTIQSDESSFRTAMRAMVPHFSKQLYVRVVQDDVGLLHVLVSDIPFTEERWIIL